ncbi:MAG: zinc ABC transporter substrate-binding protein [Lachnospiraceae bacterium]|nr:zinc ABC transporter substrate-binding protein [Lachnospiraceae bacterium]
MKKAFALVLTLVLAIGLLSACGTGKNSDKLQIVTTVFPEYDWVKNVLGDRASSAEITLLCDNGVDMHSYQPTAEDVMKISTCDLFIYVGGESDAWVKKALENPKNKKRVVINLMEVLGENAKQEETVEGMENEDGEEDEAEYDEHVWLSFGNAVTFSDRIAAELGKLDPDHAQEYRDNAKQYAEKLGALKAEYQKAVDASAKKTLLLADRFPFRYLVDEFGLSYYAAFKGCSAETEASFETVIFLAGKADELGLNTVLTIDGGSRKIAEAVISNTKDKNRQILSLNSMQSVTKKDIEAGTTYLSVMTDNLEVLKQALR